MQQSINQVSRTCQRVNPRLHLTTKQEQEKSQKKRRRTTTTTKNKKREPKGKRGKSLRASIESSAYDFQRSREVEN